MIFLYVSRANAQDIHSVYVDRDQEKLVVIGADLDLVSSITLGGENVVASAPVAHNLMEIPFASPIYMAVQWPGNYNLVLDASVQLSVYISAPISPPPGPPSGGPDCACVPGWEANASLIADNWAFCQPISDGSQVGYVGSSTTAIYPGPTPWLAATAYDSENPASFDYSDPGAAISFCALDVDIDGIYEVAEPVTNIDQYNDCVNWLFREGVCL